jgi:VWFA-related protein
MRSPVVAGLLLLALTQPIRGQSAPQQPTFGTSTTTVIVDVVVRDRSQQPVTGLGPHDFEVFEDGRLQQITTFQAIDLPPLEQRFTTEDTRSAPAQTAALPDSQPPPVTALVFEQLSPAARRLAEQGAAAFVNDALAQHGFTGVFAIDRALHVLVPYTNDADALREAIRTASLRPGYPIERVGRHPNAEHGSFDTPQTTKDEEPFARAHATFDALYGLIDTMRLLPGRKAVILFSEGFALAAPDHTPMIVRRSPHRDDHWLFDNRREAFTRVLEHANRAQVAFYTFDAAGLRADHASSGRFGADPYVGLQILAQETGGAFIENTNDLVPGVRRVGADLRQYYLLGYTPTNTRQDDRYRSIRVRVKRPGLQAFSRQGYRPTGDTQTVELRAYEAAPLLLLEQPTLPDAFPIRVGALAFPQPERPGRIAILAHVSAGELTYAANDGSAGYEAALTVLARVRDERGVPTGYVSERFTLSGPLENLLASKGGEIIFYKEPELPAGRHTVEVIAYDEHARRASARAAPLDVPPVASGGLHVSSLVMVGRVEQVPPTEAQGGNPLYVGNVLAYPNLGEPIKKTDGAITLFLTVVPAAGRTPSAELELLRGAEALAKVPLRFDESVNGRIQQLWRVPIDRLEPGDYTFRVVVADGSNREVRETSVRVVD